MFEGIINGAKSVISGTTDVVQNNTAGAVGVGILSIAGWEIFGKKMCLWSANKIKKSATMVAAKAQSTNLLRKDDSAGDHELREKIMATTKKVDVLADAAAEKIMGAPAATLATPATPAD